MVTLHSDNEPAICWVRDKVQTCLTERGMSVTTRASPIHSSQSNGGAERAIQSVRGLARTLVTQVEQRTGLTFGGRLLSLDMGLSTCWMDLDTIYSAWLRPSLFVRNEKGTRCVLGIARMRFCKVTCWRKFMLNPQWRPRNLQMLYGGFTKPFQVSRGDLLHGVRIDGILGGSPLDFRRSLVDPCLWTHSTTGVRIGRHMDDFI